MLTWESLHQTIWLILMNAYRKEKSEIFNLYMMLYRKCSSLFDSLLSRSEQQSLRSSLLKNEDENSSITLLQSNSLHLQIIATECLFIKYCKEILELLTRAFDSTLMTSNFKYQLRTVLKKKFDMLNVMHFETAEIQWCKKVSFTSE